MDNMKKNYSNSDITVHVGDRIILDDQEWKVAEIISDTVVLYRESVSGKSLTIQEPPDVIKSHFQEQYNGAKRRQLFTIDTPIYYGGRNKD